MTSAPTLSGGVLLSAGEYLVAWQHLGLGLVHWNLQPPSGPQRSAEESAAAHQRAWAVLQARGLAGVRRLAPELEDALRLIAQPAVELNARLDLPGGRCTVVGCARGEYAALAELSEGGMRIHSVRPTALPIVVAGTVPEQPAGSGTAVSVPADLLPDDQGLTGGEVESALRRGGVRADDARRLRAMLHGPKLGGGTFGAARRDRHGSRCVAEFVLTYYVTDCGGYTIEQKRGVDRSRWYTLAPASHPQLGQRLARLLDTIRI